MSSAMERKVVRTVWDAFDAGARASRCAKELGDLSISLSVATTEALKQWADTLNETDQKPEPAGPPPPPRSRPFLTWWKCSGMCRTGSGSTATRSSWAGNLLRMTQGRAQSYVARGGNHKG